mmetsp:Transcript_59316/g.165610  ORF Transcript_59316/g.165610 Transcript_59316/m.165610 type:complete len:107 (-) Transcript_59316:77-397(-)
MATADDERALVYERIDVAIRGMMEGYMSVIEAAKVSSRNDMAVNSYSMLVRTAAMSRAAEELLRIAGEVGCALALVEEAPLEARPEVAGSDASRFPGGRPQVPLGT